MLQGASKWVFFVRELLTPLRVPAGGIREFSIADYRELAASPGSGEAMLDITPGPVARALGAFPFGALQQKKASSAVLYPCPWCVEVNPKTRQMRLTRLLTKCKHCDDARSVPIPGQWPGAERTLGAR